MTGEGCARVRTLFEHVSVPDAVRKLHRPPCYCESSSIHHEAGGCFEVRAASGERPAPRHRSAWALASACFLPPGVVAVCAPVQLTGPKHDVESAPQADGSVLVRNGQGSAHLIRVQRGIVLYTCSGFLARPFYGPMVSVAQREIDAAGELHMLVDGWDLRSVDTGFREAWTTWFKSNRQNFRMQLLVRTKLMEMAASLANLFTGLSVITTHSSIGGWERACSKSIPDFRRSEPTR